MKYSYENKLRAVRAVIEKHESLLLVAKRLGTDKTHLHRWIALYQGFGAAGLKHRANSYSPEFKLSVLEFKRQNHLSLRQTATKFNIPNESVILQWERIYHRDGSDGLYKDNRGKMKKPKPPTIPKDSTDNQTLLKELEYLRAENAYLKK